jgi:uncharacterized protein YndB with AHSA1/START domain
VLLAVAGPAAATPPCIACRAERDAVLARYDPEALSAMREGRVRTDGEPHEDGGRAVRAAMIVDAPPAEVWRHLTAYERWPEFVPRLRGLEVLRRREPVRLRHHVAVVGMDVRYGTLRTLDPARGRIEARLDPAQDNALRTHRTRWQLLPLADGARTLVEVRSHLRTGWSLPGFLEEMLLRRTLPGQMRAFRDVIEAEDRAASRRGGAPSRRQGPSLRYSSRVVL